MQQPYQTVIFLIVFNFKNNSSVYIRVKDDNLLTIKQFQLTYLMYFCLNRIEIQVLLRFRKCLLKIT